MGSYSLNQVPFTIIPSAKWRACQRLSQPDQFFHKSESAKNLPLWLEANYGCQVGKGMNICSFFFTWAVYLSHKFALALARSHSLTRTTAQAKRAPASAAARASRTQLRSLLVPWLAAAAPVALGARSTECIFCAKRMTHCATAVHLQSRQISTRFCTGKAEFLNFEVCVLLRQSNVLCTQSQATYTRG